MIKAFVTAALLVVTMNSVARELPPVLVTGFAEFGPDTSRSKACDRAMSDAKRNALRDQYGEKFGQKSILTCDENIQQQTGNDCELFENTWSMLNPNGFISKIRQPEPPKITEQLGLSICKVTAYITIEEYEGQPDYAFETEIRVSQGMNLRLSDKPVIEIESNKPAFHYVYYWAPFVDQEFYYQLFPNPHDSQTERLKRLRIPTGQATKNYSFEVLLPEGMIYSHEYLIVVSSKQPLPSAPEKIKEVNFFQWLKSFDRRNWTQSTFNYRVLGDSTWQT